MNKLFILVLIGIGISINGYATVGTRVANAEYFNIRLSNGTTVCAQSATTIGKKVIYRPCLAQKKDFKTLSTTEILAVTDMKGDSVQLKQAPKLIDEQGKATTNAKVSLIMGIIALLTGLCGLFIRLIHAAANINFGAGASTEPNIGGNNLLKISFIAAMIGLICGAKSLSWFKKKALPPNSATARATGGIILSVLMLLTILLLFM
jgi:hypothetical protein